MNIAKMITKLNFILNAQENIQLIQSILHPLAENILIT